MSSPRILEPQRIAAAFALTLLIALMLPFNAQAAEKVRTDAGDLPGYTLSGAAAPLSILMYEPVIPVPVEPGEPHGEGSLSYTSTKLETGPVARAVASSFWPGAAVGDGFQTICQQGQESFEGQSGQKVPDCPPESNWQIKADANYPGNQSQAKEIPPTKSGMQADAEGLDVVATASSGMSPNEEALALGNAASKTLSTVKNGKALSSTVSSVKNISIGGGAITIESVKTELEATATSKKGDTEGATKVSGLVIGGQGYTVDNKGVHPIRDGRVEDPAVPLPTMPGSKELNENLGIQVEIAKHKESVNGADASRKAGGLRISIRTAVLKDAITSNLPVGQILDSAPEEITSNFAAVAQLAPQIDFVFGRGEVRAAGAEGITIPEFDLSLPPAPAPPATTGGSTLSSGDTAAGGASAPSPAIASGDAGASSSGALAPVAAGGAAATTATAAQVPLFGGIPAGVTAAGLVLAALGGRSLAWLTGAAMSGLGGPTCEHGVPRKMPDLRA